MRIARFTAGADPVYGIVEGDAGEERVAEIAGDPLYVDPVPTGPVHDLKDVRLLAPVIPRSKIVGIGRNYADHAAELGNEVPAEPGMFLKPNTSVVGPGDPIVIPWQSTSVSFEGELAVVIGRLCKDVPPERVPEVVYGYTCANDVTARDLQKTDLQWARAKGFDTFCPLGPWVVTADELAVDDLSVRTLLDGEVAQDGRTSQMVHDVVALVSAVSEAFTLLPGDVILTGTPAGVATMTDGQLVEVQVEGIGVLSNRVRDSGAGGAA